jgi:hypothetical protein
MCNIHCLLRILPLIVGKSANCSGSLSHWYIIIANKKRTFKTTRIPPDIISFVDIIMVAGSFLLNLLITYALSDVLNDQYLKKKRFSGYRSCLTLYPHMLTIMAPNTNNQYRKEWL